MALTNEEILEAIASKTVLEISELIKMMEEKFGVSAAAAGQTHKFYCHCLSFLLKERKDSER
jgi:ribosomal protein L7/L12